MSRLPVRRRRASMRNLFGAMLATVLTSTSVFAQTNGTWNVQGGNWSVGTNWVGGNIADGGGIATFDNFRGQLSNITVTVDTTSRTLSQINFNQSFSVSIAGSGGGSILVSPNGLTLNSIASTVSSPTSYYNTVNGISAVIAGSGNLVKTGQGNVALSGANTFTGNVVINEGALWLTAGTAAGQDTALGNVANSVQLNGGTLGVSTNALTTSRSFVIGPNGGTMRLFAAANLNGSLSGSGLLTNQLGTLTLGGTTSGFSGGILVDNGTVNLTGTTALGGSADVVVGGTLGLVNTTNNVANRLNGRSIVSYGGNLNFTAGTAGTMNEAAGNLVLASGSTTVSVNPSASTGANVSFTGLTRQDRSTILFRGTGLGANGAVANVLFTSSPGTLIGGGGNPNSSTNASILPFAIGSRVSGVTSGANISFVTWDSATQRITALDVTSGYATNLASAASDDNVNLTANSSVNLGGQTINSLRFGGAFTLDGASSDILTVTSGAILSTTGTAVINAPINFGVNEGVVFASGALTINGAISG